MIGVHVHACTLGCAHTYPLPHTSGGWEESGGGLRQGHPRRGRRWENSPVEGTSLGAGGAFRQHEGADMGMGGFKGDTTGPPAPTDASGKGCGLEESGSHPQPLCHPQTAMP